MICMSTSFSNQLIAPNKRAQGKITNSWKRNPIVTLQPVWATAETNIITLWLPVSFHFAINKKIKWITIYYVMRHQTCKYLLWCHSLKQKCMRPLSCQMLNLIRKYEKNMQIIVCEATDKSRHQQAARC